MLLSNRWWLAKSVGRVSNQQPLAVFLARYFAEPQSSPTGNPVLGREVPLCNRFGFVARRPCGCGCDTFPGREGFFSHDDRSPRGFCSSLRRGLPSESRPDLSAFRDRSTEPVEVSGSRGASLGRTVSSLVVPGPPACKVTGEWNATAPSIALRLSVHECYGDITSVRRTGFRQDGVVGTVQPKNY